MRAIVLGYGGFGHAGLSAALRAGLEVPLVLTHADHPGEVTWWESMEALARARGIPCLVDADTARDDVLERMRAARPDVILSCFYRHMVGQGVLGLAPGYNLHTSLLPRFRGRAPINWQLVHGVRESGLTLHRMVARADAGGIVAQEALAVDPDWDAYQFTLALLDRAPAFLDAAFAAIRDGRAVERAQDLAQGSVFGRRTPADGRIDWTWPARRIHDLVRAVAPPWPGAFCELDGRRVVIARTRVAAEDGTHAVPGTVLPGWRIACGSGTLGVLAAYAADGAVTLGAGSVLR